MCDFFCFRLRRLGFHLGGLVALRPAAVILLRHVEDLLRLDVAHDQQRRVLRPVEPLEEIQAVVVVARHGLDVVEETDRRVLVGVLGEGELPHLLEHRLDGVRNALVVLAQHGQGLGAERVFGVLQVLEAVGLHVHHGGQLAHRADDVVGRPVVGRVGVRIGAHPLEDVVVLVLRVLVGTAEHHVLEEVGEAAVAWLDLVAGAGAHHGVIGHRPRAVVGDDDHLEAVVERGLVDLVGEDVTRRSLLFSGAGHGGE